VSDTELRAKEREAAAGDRKAELAARHDRCRAGRCCAHAPVARAPVEVPELQILWYENEQGERFQPPSTFSPPGTPGRAGDT
jgi:hypothetical protein